MLPTDKIHPQQMSFYLQSQRSTNLLLIAYYNPDGIFYILLHAKFFHHAQVANLLKFSTPSIEDNLQIIFHILQTCFPQLGINRLSQALEHPENHFPCILSA